MFASGLSREAPAVLESFRDRPVLLVRRRDLQDGLVAAAFLTVAALVGWRGLSAPVGLAAAALGLTTVGVPHGQFDWGMARSRLKPQLGRRWAAAFLGAYLGLAALTLVVWLRAPALGLASFLVFSVIHFGLEDQQAGLGAASAPAAASVVVRGALPFIVPAMAHPDRMAWWVSTLTGADLGPVLAQLDAAVAIMGPVWLCGAVALAVLYARAGRSAAVAEWLAASVALAVLPIVPGFLLWFLIGHSPRHLVQVFEAEPGRGRLTWLMRRLGVGAVVSAAVLVALGYLAHAASEMLAIRVAVAGLAALTLPHLLTCAFLQPRTKAVQPAKPGELVA